MTPRDREALERIVESAVIVAGYAERAGADWTSDAMVVDAIAKRIEEIGETAKRIGTTTLASMPEIDWRGLKGIREILAHDYDDIDIAIVDDVVRAKLPQVVTVVRQRLAAGE